MLTNGFYQPKNFVIYMNLKTFEIDSFKLRIPTDKATNLSDTLNQYVEEITINTNTGAVVKEKSKLLKDFVVEEEGFTTKYELRNFINPTNNKESIEYYLIKITSKHLRNRYFEGITKDNINLVYESIQNQKILDLSFEDFINSYATDVDFQKLHYNNSYQDFLEVIRKANTYNKRHTKLHHLDTTNRKDNQGFQFSDRNQSTLTAPYIKYYNKEKQIKSNKQGGMNEFYNLHLKQYESEIKNLYRIEYTMKDLRMLKKYGLSGSNKLIDLLNIPNEIKEGVAKDIFAIYTEKPIQQIRTAPTKLNKNEKVALIIKDYATRLGYSYFQIEEHIKNLGLGYRVEKKLLEDIKIVDFEDEENTLNQKLEKNNYIEGLLKEIGFY